MNTINMFLFMVLVLFTVYIQKGDSCCKFRLHNPNCEISRFGPKCKVRAGCFGCGPCNIFCCNCDDGCCPNRKRRALPEFLNINPTTIANGIKYFHTVDLNEDYVISPDEFVHYIQHNDMLDGKYDKALLSQYFNQTDLNADGFIQPVEFDRKLENVELSY